MTDLVDNKSRITKAAWFVALATLVMGQLHALARFATADGRSDLDLPLTGWWAEPTARAFESLLDWADADTVYLTYGKWWLPAIAVTTVAAFLVRRLRAPYGSEKWGWRVTLTGLIGLAVGVALTYWTQWTSYNALFDIALLLTLPGMLLAFVGSTLLGIALLRRGVRPRMAAVLLVLAIPGFLLISEVTSLGNTTLPIMFAIAMLATAETRPGASERSVREVATAA